MQANTWMVPVGHWMHEVRFERASSLLNSWRIVVDGKSVLRQRAKNACGHDFAFTLEGLPALIRVRRQTIKNYKSDLYVGGRSVTTGEPLLDDGGPWRAWWRRMRETPEVLLPATGPTMAASALMIVSLSTETLAWLLVAILCTAALVAMLRPSERICLPIGITLIGGSVLCVVIAANVDPIWAIVPLALLPLDLVFGWYLIRAGRGTPRSTKRATQTLQW